MPEISLDNLCNSTEKYYAYLCTAYVILLSSILQTVDRLRTTSVLVGDEECVSVENVSASSKKSYWEQYDI